MVAAVTLGLLLALLAFLQYRWLGQVSEGERQRMRTTLEARARDFAADFDRELSKAAAAFAAPMGPGLEAEWDRWQATAANAKLIRAVFVVDRSTPEVALRRFDPATRQLVPAEWPDAFRAARERWAEEFAKSPTAPPAEAAQVPSASTVPHVQHLGTRVFVDDLSDVPALVVPVQPDLLAFTAGNVAPAAAARGSSDLRAQVFFRQQPASHITVLWLDLDEIRRTQLPALAKKYFATDEVFDYQVTVTLRRDPAVVFFETAGAAGSATRAQTAGPGDASVPMFRLRIAEIFGRSGEPATNTAAATPAQAAARPAQAPGQGSVTREQIAGAQISVMRFEGARQQPSTRSAVIALSDASGGWLLRLSHRAGSLDAAVERLRRRNLAISSTILGLLAVSLAFVLVSTRRAQRLAAQQVEFVASVSHELRTPLTVIRSAGENLADGVVESPEQVRRYGALVAEESRKLGTMVEQVMEYAGMQSNAPRWQKAPVDVRAVVDDAVAGARRLPEARQAHIEVTHVDDLPPIDADRAALVRAVQNLIENAVKYGSSAFGDRHSAIGPTERDGRQSDPAAGRPSTDARGALSGVEGREPQASGRIWVGVRVTAKGDERQRDTAEGRNPQAASRILIEVTDHGPGIDAAEQRRIFEPFVRGRAAAAARVPGNGLGLSIVKRVVEGHGGTVAMRNLADGGACFTIRLPLDSRTS
jgi:two-component system, OmpR family, sensor histidine kinase SenX3